VTLISTPEGPLVNAFTSFVGSLYPLKNVHPIFAKSSGDGAKFCFHYTGTPKARRGINFANCTLAHFQEIEFRNFAENRLFSSYWKYLVVKNIDSVHGCPPITGPKFAPRMTFRIFSRILKKSAASIEASPIESVNSQ